MEHTAGSTTQAYDTQFSPDQNGYTPLMRAIQEENDEEVEEITRKAHPPHLLDFQNEIDCKTALHLAVEKPSTRYIKQLLGRSASVGLRDNRGNTPFHLACSLDNADTLNLLLKHARDDQQRRYFLMCLDTRNADGYTCFHLAVHSGHTGTIKVLAHFGANVNAKDKMKAWTALHFAADSGNFRLVKYLVKKVNIKLTEEARDGRSALALALEGRHKKGMDIAVWLRLAEEAARQGSINVYESDSDDSDDVSLWEARGSLAVQVHFGVQENAPCLAKTILEEDNQPVEGDTQPVEEDTQTGFLCLEGAVGYSDPKESQKLSDKTMTGVQSHEEDKKKKLIHGGKVRDMKAAADQHAADVTAKRSEMGTSGGLSDAEVEAQDLSDDKATYRSAYDIPDMDMEPLLESLNAVTQLTSYYVDEDGTVQASCRKGSYKETKRQLYGIQQKHKVRLHLSAEDIRLVAAGATDPRWRLSAVSDTNTTVPVQGYGSPGLPVTVMKGGEERKPLMGCCHVVSRILQDTQVEDTSQWFRKISEQIWDNKNGREVKLKQSTFVAYNYCTSKCGGGIPSQLGTKAQGFVGDRADVALVYLDHEEAEDDIPTVPRQTLQPNYVLAKHAKHMRSKDASKRGGTTAFTKGRVVGGIAFCKYTDFTTKKGNPFECKHTNVLAVACDNINDTFATQGDSGSPMYVKDQNTWKLLGQIVAVELRHPQSDPLKRKHGKVAYVIPVQDQINCLNTKFGVDVKVVDVHACYPSSFRY